MVYQFGLNFGVRDAVSLTFVANGDLDERNFGTVASFNGQPRLTLHRVHLAIDREIAAHVDRFGGCGRDATDVTAAGADGQ